MNTILHCSIPGKLLQHEACTAVSIVKVFAILKADDKYEKFVFITGITKFTQISLFSVLNNLSNISFEPEYAAICGITKEEVLRDFKPEINKLAEYEDWTFDEAVAQLTAYYDGYHFSRRNMVDVFNPFSLINALSDSDLKNYWASSGATSMLPKFVDDLEIRLKDFDHSALLSTIIETSDVTGGGSELFLYQSGYLTIKGYMNGTYLLGIPNFEVRQALNEIVLPTLAMRKNNAIQSTQAFLNLSLRLWQSSRSHEMSESSHCGCALQQQETCQHGHGGAIPPDSEHHLQCHRLPGGSRKDDCYRQN